MTTSHEPQKHKPTDGDSVRQGEEYVPQSDFSITILRLQRTLGNRAVIELLTSQGALQRVKDGESSSGSGSKGVDKKPIASKKPPAAAESDDEEVVTDQPSAAGMNGTVPIIVPTGAKPSTAQSQPSGKPKSAIEAAAAYKAAQAANKSGAAGKPKSAIEAAAAYKAAQAQAMAANLGGAAAPVPSQPAIDKPKSAIEAAAAYKAAQAQAMAANLGGAAAPAASPKPPTTTSGGAAKPQAAVVIEKPQWASECDNAYQRLNAKGITGNDHEVDQQSLIRDLPAIGKGHKWVQARVENNTYLPPNLRIFIETDGNGYPVDDGAVAVSNGLSHHKTRIKGVEVFTRIGNTNTFKKYVKS